MSKKTVLIVDDVATELKKLQDIVAAAGYDVITAANGSEALSKMKSAHPDVVLLDVIMPDMNGFQVCRALKSDEATKGIPVVLVSSKSEKTDKVWAMAQGANGYITKPYTSEQIVTQLASL